MRWLGIGVLALGTFATGTDSFVIAGILLDVSRTLHVSVTLAGQLVSVFAISYAIAGPLIIAALPPLPAARSLAVTMAVFAAANLLAAAAPGYGVLLAARIIAACCAGCYSPLAASTAVTLAPGAYRGRALAIVLGGTTAATVLGAPIGVLIAHQASWRGAFLFVVVLALLAAVGLTRLLPPVTPPPGVPLRARLGPLRQRSVITLLAVMTLAQSAGFAIYTYLGPLFGQSATGVLIVAFGVAGVAGNWLGGALADRLGGGTVVFTALLVLTADFALLHWSTRWLSAAVAFAAVWGLFGWAFTPALQHSLISRVPGSAPLLLSLNASAIFLGVACGAALGGVVIAHFGASRMWLLAAPLEAVALLLAVVESRRGGTRLFRRQAERERLAADSPVTRQETKAEPSRRHAIDGQRGPIN
jgi:predicted MFS family arabinose efflux permease